MSSQQKEQLSREDLSQQQRRAIANSKHIDTYTAVASAYVDGDQNGFLWPIFEALLKGKTNIRRVLEVAAGGANLSAFLLDRLIEKNPEMEVLATDVNPEMVARAQRKHNGNDRLTIEKFDLLTGDVEGLGAKKDVIVGASFLFHVIDQVDEVMERLKSQLADNGCLFIIEQVQSNASRSYEWELMATVFQYVKFRYQNSDQRNFLGLLKIIKDTIKSNKNASNLSRYPEWRDQEWLAGIGGAGLTDEELRALAQRQGCTVLEVGPQFRVIQYQKNEKKEKV